MFRFSTRVVLLLAVSLSGVAAGGGLAFGENPHIDNSLEAIGEDFRVDNAVFAGDKKEPISQSVTIFHEGIVYDCMTKPAETVVFDGTMKRFVLLNMEDGTRAELSTREVTSSLSRYERLLKEMIAKKPDALSQFMADPKFQEQFDESAGKVTLSSPLVNYTLVLSPGRDDAAAGQYRDFSDWYARLNVLLTPRALPPFGRLAVNAAVAKRKAIPSQVTLTITSAKSGKRQTIRSTHRVVRPLTAADIQQVDRIRKAMTDFKPVDFEKYRKGEMK
ncbi:MAG: hypothetical protein WCB27_23550 [Thermoguttaceae bacterium]|jgi:hypothetical protein